MVLLNWVYFSFYLLTYFSFLIYIFLPKDHLVLVFYFTHRSVFISIITFLGGAFSI